jgi:CIC family chloride channel protein
MVGMAAVLAGTVNAPLTAIVLLFEMTDNYRIILPLMFAVAVSVVIARRIQSDAVYSLGLARKGVRLERGRDVEVLEAITVGEVMQTDTKILHESDSLSAAAEVLNQTRHHGLPVLNHREELVGILTVQDIDRLQAEGDLSKQTVTDACTRDLLTAFPEEAIGAALRRMSVRDVGRLPVVTPSDPRQLVGVLRRTDIVRAYDLALSRRASIRHQAHQIRLGATVDGRVSVEEIRVEDGAPCVGKHVHEVVWPRDCVLVTLKRGRQVIIPRGETILKAGDLLTIVSDGPVTAEIHRLLLRSGERHV